MAPPVTWNGPGRVFIDRAGPETNIPAATEERAAGIGSVPPAMVPPPATSPATALWRPRAMTLSDVPPPEAAADVPVVSLDQLYERLADPAVQDDRPPDEVIQAVLSAVQFYGSWFPEETRAQFARAHQRLRATGRRAGPVLLALEQRFAPDARRFVAWVTTAITAWTAEAAVSRCFDSDEAMLRVALIVETARQWAPSLDRGQRAQLRRLFAPALRVLKDGQFSWPKGIEAGGLFGRLMVRVQLVGSVAELAGDSGRDVVAQLTPAFFTQPAEVVLRRIVDDEIVSAPLTEPRAARLWRFLAEAPAHLRGVEDYWSAVRTLVSDHPALVPQFLDRAPQWLAEFAPVTLERFDPPARRFDIVYIYEQLIAKDLIPPERRAEVYRFLPTLWPEDQPTVVFQPTDTVEQMESALMRAYLINAQRPLEERRFADMLDVGRELFRRRAPQWGAERTIRWLVQDQPPSVLPQWAITVRSLRFLLDRDRAAVDAFLAELQDPARRPLERMAEDPLWRIVWEDLGGAPLTLLHEVSVSKLYDIMLNAVPALLIERQHTERVTRFYWDHHPYRPLLSIDRAQRPTGRGQTFVSIDAFHNPAEVPHQDKGRAALLPLSTPRFLARTTGAHGMGTSALAVGERFGLAPDADLLMAPILADDPVNLPRAMTDALASVERLRRQRPDIAVVGLSLGITVPRAYRPLVTRSAIYRALETQCRALHAAGIAIVVSAGNSGEKDEINILGMLPHVTVVGAANSHLTTTLADDTESQYSTGRAGDGAVQLWAQADPALYLLNRDELEWAWQGGTSAAQPQVSGTLLLLREVNPTLTVDQQLLLLRHTADAATRDPAVAILDPMEAVVAASFLPGSRYAAEARTALARQLGFAPETYPESPAMQRLRAALATLAPPLAP